MFQSLTEKLQGVFQRLRGKGTLHEQDVNEALREVRLALLGADVHFKVARDFENRVRERAVGSEVLESLTPAQQVIKIVHDELCELLGEDAGAVRFNPRPPTVILMVGLQGSGKTTTCAKLANLVRKQGRRPFLVACDIYRPAAIKQLEVVGQGVNVPVHANRDERDVVRIAREGLEAAHKLACDVVIVDTAGRLHVDEDMMGEVQRLEAALQPAETFLVLDSMTGQDAVNVAREFSTRLKVTGFILTKLDGDTRGGAAISIRAVTGIPIRFVGVGEKAEALEPFHPSRMVSRILGMGDVMSLIERAQSAVDEKEALALEQKIRGNRFTLEDFLTQMQQVRKMGPLKDLLGALPMMGGASIDIPEKELARIEAIIQSMTREERLDPGILNGSRRRRIARGSGTTVQEVNQLLNQFSAMQKHFAAFRKLQTSKKPMRGMGSFMRRR